MAIKNVVSVAHGTLLPGVVDQVVASYPFATARVSNRGAVGPIYVRLDGTDPAVEGNDSYLVPQGEYREFPVPTPSAWDVRLVCAAGAMYCVEGV